MPSLQASDRLSLGGVLRSAAVPFLFFAAVLFTLLFLSWVLLLPRLTQLDIAGQSRGSGDLKSLKADLLREITDLEQQRDDYLLPGGEGMPEGILERRRIQSEVLTARTAIERTAASLIPDTPDAVRFHAFRYDAAARSLTLDGAIHAGPASMTVLAQFVAALKALPMVASLESPRYTRVQADDGSFSSPFVIPLTLQ